VKWLAVAALALCSSALALLPDTRVSGLPAEAQQTLVLIRSGGPFPYARDGVEFRNREGLLPKRGRGYYREYTVKTPGAKDRGARRIVAGQAGEYYYTDDHYRSFRRIIEE
jgi:ribonuclease T1